MAQEINTNDRLPDTAEVSALSLAYIGDACYELIIRSLALATFNGKAGDLNKIAKSYTNAQAQCRIGKAVEPHLTEAEEHVFKRGRNAKSISAPKTCTIGEYRVATGLEALIGYLYLKGDMERAKEIVKLGIDLVKAGEQD
ncbi:MAG: ribonuclease III [Parasporobacterium sp.]|nr:ribonuclease III [Parasporobacterium sp.]